ncbi:outer membrane beta-barrel protein [Mucilaginibacter sp.]
MYKISCLLVFSLCLTAASFAQNGGSVTAKVTEAQTGQPVEMATATVIRLPDSAVVKRVASDRKGVIYVSGLGNSSYILKINLLGLKTETRNFSITAQRQSVDLGTVKMEPDVRLLKSVEVQGQKDPVAVKGDTTEFNAGSYKTQVNDNVESLLKKLPGVEIDRQGNVKAQGKQVTRVLVDGKEFFGNDPKAATKNLPASAIDKVQVIDDKTENAKNTGIDDGQREKVINLKLKADHKKGIFGNTQALAGTDSRYLGQLNLNHFDNKKQLSILTLSNNVNESGFSYEDLNTFTGNNVFGAFSNDNGGVSLSINRSGRANVNDAFSGVQDGLIKYNSGGLNYSDVFGKKEQLKFNISAIGLVTSNYLTQLTDIQDNPNNLFSTQNSIGRNVNNNYRVNMNFDYKPDTLNNIKLKPFFSYSYKTTNTNSGSATTTLTRDSVNRLAQLLDQKGNTPVAGGQLSINHKFRGGKGSVNLAANGSYTANNLNYTNQYTARFYTPLRDSVANQHTDQDNSSTYLNGTASMIRQVNKKKQLNFTLSEQFSYRNNNASQYTVDYDAVTGRYDVYNPDYSAISDSHTWGYTTNAGITKSGKGLNWNINLALANQGMSGSYVVRGQTGPIDRNVWAFVPNAWASYRTKTGGNLYVSFYSSVQLPSVTDLQPAVNNTNLLYVRLGNPDLNIARTYSINANYNKFDVKTNSYFGFYGYYAQVWNGFSTESFVNEGITTNRPINTDGNFNSNVGFNWGKPTKVKGLKFNIGTYGQFNRSVNYINGNQNAVLRIMPQLYSGVNYDRDKVQLSLTGAINYNSATNSFQRQADQKYTSFDDFASASVKPNKNWRLFTDVNQRLFRGQPSSANTSFYIWNAGIERYFLAKQNLTVSVNAFDLLDQNAGLRRTITNTGQIQNIQTNTISRYFYVKLVYKLLKFDDNGAKKNNGGLIIL